MFIGLLNIFVEQNGFSQASFKGLLGFKML